MMTRLGSIIAVLALILGSLFIAAPAQADCVKQHWGSTVIWRMGPSHVAVNNTVYFKKCSGGVKVVLSAHYGYGPAKYYNDRITCDSRFRKVRFNPSPIAGYDPPAITKPCYPSGWGKWVDFPDKRNPADKCINMKVSLYRGGYLVYRDWTRTTPRACA